MPLTCQLQYTVLTVVSGIVIVVFTFVLLFDSYFSLQLVNEIR